MALYHAMLHQVSSVDNEHDLKEMGDLETMMCGAVVAEKVCTKVASARISLIDVEDKLDGYRMI
jgi:hypothetical protein